MATDIDFNLQMLIWGYAVLGESAQPDAMLVEQIGPPSTHQWDQTADDLKGYAVDRGNGWMACPEWWALHHLPWSMREEAYAVLAGHFDGSEGAR